MTCLAPQVRVIVRSCDIGHQMKSVSVSKVQTVLGNVEIIINLNVTTVTYMSNFIQNASFKFKRHALTLYTVTSRVEICVETVTAVRNVSSLYTVL